MSLLSIILDQLALKEVLKDWRKVDVTPCLLQASQPHLEPWERDGTAHSKNHFQTQEVKHHQEYHHGSTKSMVTSYHLDKLL